MVDDHKNAGQTIPQSNYGNWNGGLIILTEILFISRNIEGIEDYNKPSSLGSRPIPVDKLVGR